ncbi:Regulatory protein PchR [Paenibacillus konkukensis]|uniref:Regulatory protein PchR n=2 Tax=Paenibacillus TaxID=44249 RepID=A0ABY4RF27_9BACL|nr:AraC family transcriptional regulator [Paenibacillus konkukensis]UQZ80865.1 Regulatory protein PchR [Paenibacillus konkukensis]
MSAAVTHSIYDSYFDALSLPRLSDEAMQRIAVGTRVGEGYMNWQVTRSGLIVIESDCRFSSDRTIELQSDASMMELSFCMQGEGEFEVSGARHDIRPGSCSLHLMSNFEASFLYKKGKAVQSLAIGIPVPLFDDYMKQAVSGFPGPRGQVSFAGLLGSSAFRTFRTALGERTLAILRQLKDCPYSNAMRSMYVESKALELLAFYLQAFLFERPADSPSSRQAALSKSDREKVRQAKETLIGRMAHPPSLIELSRMVGLNDYKLKIGFKEEYGKSAFAYLRDKRLEKA